MRTLRNLMYFFLGFSLMVAWGFAHAISVNDMYLKLNTINPTPDGSFHRGYIGPNSGVGGSPSPVVISGDSFAQFKSRYLVPSPIGVGKTVPVDDSFKFGKSALLPGIINASKNGFKGLTAGVPGFIGSVIGGMVMQGLIDRGMQWMSDSKCASGGECFTSPMYPLAPYSPLYDMVVILKISGNPLIGRLPNSLGDWNYIYANKAIYGPIIADICRGAGYPDYQWPYTYPECGKNGSMWQTSIGRWDTLTPNQPRPTVIVSAADLQAAIQAVVDAKWPQIAQAAVDEKEVIEVPKTTQIVLLSQTPMYPDPTVTTTTSTDANGNPVTKITTSQPKVTAKPGTTVADPITTQVENTSTTSTRTCDSAGANCVTKTDTTTTSPSETPPKEDPCALNPDIVGCMKVGTPTAPDVPTQTYNIPFNQVSFSLPTTCPAPVSMATHLGTYQFSFEYICQYAAGIRYLFLLVCSIGAYFIIAGSLQRKTA